MNKGDIIFDIEPLEKRAKGIRGWLERNGRGCFDEQKHTRAGTVEKIYWHYGYMAALTDVLRFLGREITIQSFGESSSPPHTKQPDKCN